MNDPMNLKNLPNYLKNLKQNNKFDENLVVDMGNIIVEKPTSRIPRAISYLSIALFLFLGIAAATYNNLNYYNTTIVLDANTYDFEEISKMLSEDGVKVVSIKQNEDKSYEVKLSKIKDLNSLMERLRQNKELKRVEVKK